MSETKNKLINLRAWELLENPIPGNFDFEHFKKIYTYLFQDVHSSPATYNASIDSEAKRIFDELKSEKYLRDLPAKEFAERLAYYLGEINALHPFREGNGRTQREFVRQLAYQNNYFLSFAGITQDEMIKASKASLKLNYGPMQDLILSHLRPFF